MFSLDVNYLIKKIIILLRIKNKISQLIFVIFHKKLKLFISYCFKTTTTITINTKNIQNSNSNI